MPTFNYSKLQEIMARCGATCSFEDFQRELNLVFHRFESDVYDREHRCMWLSLPRQFALISSDVLSVNPSRPLRLLDIGSGTGLSTELLLQTEIGKRIKRVTLLDTSAEMLAKASRRAKRWRIPFSTHHGLLESLHEEADIILACSVLHHIPDIPGFVRQVIERLPRGGTFVHLQDPNGDYLYSAETQGRIKELESLPKRPILFLDRIKDHVRRQLGILSYLQKVNHSLLERGIIRTPMSDEDIWSFTDIHDLGGAGISISEIQSLFPLLRKVSHRSYSFFGRQWSELPIVFQAEETRLTEQHSLTGATVAAGWTKS
jgi:SAM-dependent methyltransferase